MKYILLDILGYYRKQVSVCKLFPLCLSKCPRQQPSLLNIAETSVIPMVSKIVIYHVSATLFPFNIYMYQVPEGRCLYTRRINQAFFGIPLLYRNSLEEVSKDTYQEMTLHLLICISKMAATQLSAFFI
jgi:hypothetical protein